MPVNGGQAAVAAMSAAGVEVVFGIPASHVIELYDGLRAQPSIRTIVGRNEQNTVYMADGYARRSLRPGVTVVTGGPGLGNTVTGLQTAFADSSPVVVLSSDLDPADRVRAPRGIPHETYDSAALASAAGARVVRADEPEAVAGAVHEAVSPRLRERHRPTVCLLSRAALAGHPRSQSPPGACPPGEATWPTLDESSVKSACDLIRSARLPIVLAGAGVHWSGAAQQLATWLQVVGLRCLTTAPARSVLDSASTHFAGTVDSHAARSRLAAADLVLAIGTSFGAATTDNWALQLRGALIHVDIDPAEIGRHYEPTLGIVADAGAFLETMAETWTGPPRQTIASSHSSQPHPWIEALDASLAGGPRTIVSDVSMTLTWLLRSLPCGPDRRLFMPWNFMGMGWAYPAALGVQAAAPDETVVAVAGDGGALFCLGELATAAENDLPVCLVVVNNHCYGVIAELQDQLYEGRQFGVDLRGPDFASVARAFDIPAMQVRTPPELFDAIRRTKKLRRPSLIEAVVDRQVFASTPAASPIPWEPASAI